MKIANIKVELIDSMGTDISVVNAARVSFNKESEAVPVHSVDEYGVTWLKFDTNEKDKKLISYLAKHNHWTPFAHTAISIRVKAPLFVARQLGKHQIGLVWNEVSRRYVDEEPEFFMPEVWRKRAANVKQGSSEEGVVGIGNTPISIIQASLDTYNYMLKMGVCPEQARMVLPQNTMTEWIWTGNVASFARVCKLRLDSHTQKETRLVAEQIDAIVKELFPVCWDALMAN